MTARRMPTGRQRSLWQVFAIPVTIGILSAIGLFAALAGDDLWDAVGWLGLAVPLAVTAWCIARA